MYIHHGTQWAVVLIVQIKLATNWLIGEGFCKAARSKLSRNERSAHLRAMIALSEGCQSVTSWAGKQMGRRMAIAYAKGSLVPCAYGVHGIILRPGPRES